jgi:hypothetical protein
MIVEILMEGQSPSCQELPSGKSSADSCKARIIMEDVDALEVLPQPAPKICPLLFPLPHNDLHPSQGG